MLDPKTSRLLRRAARLVRDDVREIGDPRVDMLIDAIDRDDDDRLLRVCVRLIMHLDAGSEPTYEMEALRFTVAECRRELDRKKAMSDRLAKPECVAQDAGAWIKI